MGSDIKEEGQDAGAVVYYTAEHAVPVHENWPIAQNRQHEPPTGPKYLEKPARENRRVYGKIVFRELKKGKTLQEAIMTAAIRLRKDSQKFVPYDTGMLHDSAGERPDVGMTP